MFSTVPKVLHAVGGKPMLQHVIATARSLSPNAIYVVHGHGSAEVSQVVDDAELHWVEQAQQLGTGHALSQALPKIEADEQILVLYGDVPLVSEHTLRQLLNACEHNALALLTAEVDDPCGYGRVIRDDAGKVRNIVEHKDANQAQRCVREINTGILSASAGDMNRWLQQTNADNAQGEYYLTDCIAVAVAEGQLVAAITCEDYRQVLGINDKAQLAQVERIYQRMQAERLMAQGVTIMDPDRIDVRGEITVGQDVCIDVNVVLAGDVELADAVSIGPNCFISDTHIGHSTVVLANCVIEDAQIGSRCRIGPFARIRPETRLVEDVHIGNFVEIKKSNIDEGTKINHLSYVGDSQVGKHVNVGAGTITCNYDGASKHVTHIGDDAFIGSNTQLVAPVTIGKGATIGAGSTITRDTPDNELTLARSQQVTIKGWKRPLKKRS